MTKLDNSFKIMMDLFWNTTDTDMKQFYQMQTLVREVNMSIFTVLSLIGGLVMFLYGMDLMGDSLKKLAGGKLESILLKLTSSRWKGLLCTE